MGCKRCGQCCTCVSIDIQPENALWVEFHDIPLMERNGVKKLVLSAVCKHLDLHTNLCLIHDQDRPPICNEYLCKEARGDDGSAT
jgi:hypothetical protein